MEFPTIFNDNLYNNYIIFIYWVDFLSSRTVSDQTRTNTALSISPGLFESLHPYNEDHVIRAYLKDPLPNDYRLVYD